LRTIVVDDEREGVGGAELGCPCDGAVRLGLEDEADHVLVQEVDSHAVGDTVEHEAGFGVELADRVEHLDVGVRIRGVAGLAVGDNSAVGVGGIGRLGNVSGVVAHGLDVLLRFAMEGGGEEHLRSSSERGQAASADKQPDVASNASARCAAPQSTG
jgi:hypothetical protein